MWSVWLKWDQYLRLIKLVHFFFWIFTKKVDEYLFPFSLKITNTITIFNNKKKTNNRLRERLSFISATLKTPSRFLPSWNIAGVEKKVAIFHRKKRFTYLFFSSTRYLFTKKFVLTYNGVIFFLVFFSTHAWIFFKSFNCKLGKN